MVAPLATCTKEEQRPVIRFLSSEGVKPIEIHRRMKVQYGDACLSLQQVYEWTRKFMNSISFITDSPWPGQAHQVVTPEATVAAEAIAKENCRITVNGTAAHLDMSHESADYTEKWSHCVPFVFKNLRDKKYLRFAFKSPLHDLYNIQSLYAHWVQNQQNNPCTYMQKNLMLWTGSLVGVFCD